MHVYGCGNEFKRLEYLLYHQQRCVKREAATQTDQQTSNGSICANCKKGLFSKQSPPPTDNDRYTISPTVINTTKSLTDSESDWEDAIFNTICSRTPTKPTPLDMRVRKDCLGLYMCGTQQLTEDLALSSDSSSSEGELDAAAKEI
jgi:hypothetical protein